MQWLANALAEVKANAIIHAIKKKTEKVFKDISSESESAPDMLPPSTIPSPTDSTPAVQRFFRSLKTSWDSNISPKKLKKIRKDFEYEKLGSYRGMAFIEKRITKPGHFW